MKNENEVDNKDVDNNKDIVTAFIKGLNVIKAFDEENTSMTLTDVAKKVDITRASARRLLLTLESLGYVKQYGSQFSLTPRIIELGYSYFASLPWTDLAYKNLKTVSDICKLSCSVSILDGYNITCIMRVAAKRILNEGIHVGSKLPAAYSPTGRVFMAHMKDNELKKYLKNLPLQEHTKKSITTPEALYEKIVKERDQGYQIVQEELEDGLYAIAVPIYNKDNEVIATMNVASHFSHKNLTYFKNTILPLLQEAAKNTTEAIVLLKH